MLRYAQQLRVLMQRLGHQIDMGTKSGTGYRVDSVIRKLCIPIMQEMPWHLVDGWKIRAISADEREQLSSLPARWTAAEISSFVCGRPDWPFLASCFMCLWKEYADKDPDAKATLTSLCVPRPSHSSDAEDLQIVEVASEFFEEHGILHTHRT